MHYPAPISVYTSSSSDFDLRVCTPSRMTASTPNLRSICTEDGGYNDGDHEGDDQKDCQGARVAKKRRKEEYLDRSSSFVATNSELPIIDISTFNYNSYRHKLIEDNLKKRYRERQPPGDVIFNSIHLNTEDSTLGIRLNQDYDHSFFDFVEEYYDASTAMSKKEMEFLHPLDHFLVRGIRKSETVEKGTETNECTLGKNETDRRENTMEPRSIDRRALFDKNGNIIKGRVKNFSGISDSKTGNESARSMDSRKDASKTGRTSLGAGTVDSDATRISNEVATGSNVDRTRTRRSTDRKSNRETSNTRKRGGSSIAKLDKESIKVGTSSSSELESGCSESGKRAVNVTPNHSRDSSVTASNRDRMDTRKPLPWIVSNPTAVSFNRKYVNKSPDPGYKRRKRKVRSSERPSRVGSRTGMMSPRPKSANVGGTSRRESNRDSLEVEDVVKVIEDRKTSIELASMKSDGLENSSRMTFEKQVPSTVLQSSRISRKPVSKLIVPSDETDVSKRSMFENVSDRSYAKFKGKRDRGAESRSMRPTVEVNQGIKPGINDPDRSKVVLNFERPNCVDRSWKEPTSVGDDRTGPKSTAEGFLGAINKLELSKDSTVIRRGKNENRRNDILTGGETKKVAGLSNFDKTRELSRGNKSNRSWKDKTDDSRSVLESRDTLVLATNDSRTEKENFSNYILGIDDNDRIYVKNKSRTRQDAKTVKEKELVLPRGDSKVGLAMQNGLKNYIKTLKQVLKNNGNVDLVDLASLSLKDAISPELESILSASELKELQDLLNIAEIKSNLATKDVVVV